MIPPFPISTNDPHQCAFNKAYAKTRHHIENAFGLLVQKWRFLLKHLYYLGIDRTALTILTCCALHNFCLDNADNASDLSEETIRDFENEIHGYDIHDNEEDEDDVEVLIDNLDPFMHEIPLDLGNTARSTNLTTREVEDAHQRSQQRGREVRQRMANALTPLRNTAIRRLQASMREEQRQEARQARENSIRRRNILNRRRNRRNGRRHE